MKIHQQLIPPEADIEQEHKLLWGVVNSEVDLQAEEIKKQLQQ